MATKKSLKKLSRRKFIRFIGASGVLASADPLTKEIIGNIYDGFIQSANASANGVAPRNLVSFSGYNSIDGKGGTGGMTSWYFHNPLCPRPEDNAKLIFNKQVVTKINDIGTDSDGNPLYDLSYASHPVTKNGKTINMPHMFSWPIPKHGGGERSTTDICDNMLMVRGVKMPDDSHVANMIRMHQPIPGQPSIQGIGADCSTSNIPCVTIGHMMTFNSTKGAGVVKITTNPSNYMGHLLETFNQQASQSFRSSPSLKEKIYSALNFLKGENGGENNLYRGLVKSRENAEALLVSGVGEFVSQYNAAVTKYQDLIDRSIRNTNLPGLTSSPLPGIQFPLTFTGNVSELKGTNGENDYRHATCQFNHYDRYMSKSDLRDIFNNAEMSGLAKQYAMIEVLIKNQLSSTINCQLKGISHLETTYYYKNNININFDANTNRTTITANPNSEENDSTYHGYDNHSGGYLFSLLSYTLSYRAFATCLAQLQDELRTTNYANGKNAWDETIVYLYSEMGRKPDDRGTDHYGNGNAMAIWGGILKFDCLGDIWNSNGHHRYIGTYGSGKEMSSVDQNLNNRRILNENMMSTLCALARYDRSPTPNNKSIVFVNELTGEVTYKIPTGRTFVFQG